MGNSVNVLISYLIHSLGGEELTSFFWGGGGEIGPLGVSFPFIPSLDETPQVWTPEDKIGMAIVRLAPESGLVS